MKKILQKAANRFGYSVSKKREFDVSEEDLISEDSLDSIETLLVSIDRYELLSYLPLGGTVAEVGVSTGGFSSLIWNVIQPEVLHLIDPWCFQDRKDYTNDPVNQTDGIQEKKYSSVIELFKEHIKNGKIFVHRDFSTSAVESFSEKSLDWVYIDALHSYEAVKNDLEMFSSKIKDDGFILGHDFAKHAEARAMGFGVVEAVCDFLKERSYHLLVVTNESYPTYVLSRNKHSNSVKELLSKLLKADARLIEVPPDIFLDSNFRHKLIKRRGGEESMIYSLSST